MNSLEKQNFNKENFILLAKLAQQTERYDEMVEFVNQIIKMNQKITCDERSLISAAFKNAAGNKRAELRVLNAIERKEHEKDNITNEEYAKNYRQQIESELQQLCELVIQTIDEVLMQRANDLEDRVFYFKMKADYFRYLCEFVVGAEFNENSQKAKKAYFEAQKLCEQELQPTNPVRLGLYLNMAVFFYEIYSLNDEKYRQEALKIADQAFEDALQSIDSVNEQNYKDCTLIMQLLKDNYTLWKQELENEQNNNVENQMQEDNQ